MPIILELKNEVIFLDGAEEESALEQVTAQVYEKIVRRNPKHLLVQLKERLALDKVATRCAGFHSHQVGMRGQAPQHAIKQLCASLLLRHLYGWSQRKTAEELGTHLLLRWFVGYGLHEQTLSYSTLRRFEEWVKQNQVRLFFDEILRMVDAEFPQERTKKQYGDTFAMQSRAATMSRTAMMRDAARRLLKYLAAAAPTLAQKLCSDHDSVALFGAEEEACEEWLPVAERKRLEILTAQAAYSLLERFDSLQEMLPQQRDATLQMALHWQGLLSKILHDEFEFSCDETELVNAALRTKPIKGSYRLGSTIDPQATFRNHGKKSQLGYNINIASTDNFVREISAVTGATPDASGIPALIQEQLLHLGVVPPKMLYDQAAGHPKYFAQVHTVSQGQTQLVARLVNSGRKSNRFGPRDFVQGEQGELTCPNGQISTTAFRSGGGDGYNYRFSPHQCCDCPLTQKCRSDKVKADKPRQVFISSYAFLRRDILAYTLTPEFDIEMKERSHVERIIAGLTRYNGARHARSFGVVNADFQAKMSALAFNAKRFVKLLTQNASSGSRNRASPHEP